MTGIWGGNTSFPPLVSTPNSLPISLINSLPISLIIGALLLHLTMTKQLNVQVNEDLLLVLDITLKKLKKECPTLSTMSKSMLVEILITKSLVEASTKCKLIFDELFKTSTLPSYVTKPCYGFFCLTCHKMDPCRNGNYSGTHPGCPEELKPYVQRPFLTLDELPTQN